MKKQISVDEGYLEVTLQTVYTSKENSHKKPTSSITKYLERECKRQCENIPPSSEPKDHRQSAKKISILNIVKAYSPMSQGKASQKSPNILLNNTLASFNVHHNTQDSSGKTKCPPFWTTNKQCHLSAKKIKGVHNLTHTKSTIIEEASVPVRPLASQKGATVASKPNLHTKQKFISDFKEEDYEFGDIVGKGRFGEVFLVRHKASDLVVAAKVMHKSTMMKYRASRQLVREIKIHSVLDHPNIIKCYGVLQNEENVYMLMEYAPNGNLYTKLKEFVGLDHLGHHRRAASVSVPEPGDQRLQTPARQTDPAPRSQA